MGLKKYKLHLSSFFSQPPFFLFCHFNIEFYLNLIKIFFDIVNNNLLFHGFHFIKLIKIFLVRYLINIIYDIIKSKKINYEIFYIYFDFFQIILIFLCVVKINKKFLKL